MRRAFAILLVACSTAAASAAGCKPAHQDATALDPGAVLDGSNAHYRIRVPSSGRWGKIADVELRAKAKEADLGLRTRDRTGEILVLMEPAEDTITVDEYARGVEELLSDRLDRYEVIARSQLDGGAVLIHGRASVSSQKLETYDAVFLRDGVAYRVNAFVDARAARDLEPDILAAVRSFVPPPSDGGRGR